MRYMGSKNKIAKHLLPNMLKHKNESMYWVEPFVGGSNMLDKVSGKRIGNDTNFYLIELFKALQKGYIPPTEVSKEFYYNLKNNIQNFEPALVGFVGFLCSFGGRWWGGYAFEKKRSVNFAERGSRLLVKQIQNLKDVEYVCGSYKNLTIPSNSLVYCDPPYSGMKKYHIDFDSCEFWQWCREMCNDHIVFISEYNAPNDFIAIKTITHKTIMNKNSCKVTEEKLFIHNSQLHLI